MTPTARHDWQGTTHMRHPQTWNRRADAAGPTRTQAGTTELSAALRIRSAVSPGCREEGKWAIEKPILSHMRTLQAPLPASFLSAPAGGVRLAKPCGTPARSRRLWRFPALLPGCITEQLKERCQLVQATFIDRNNCVFGNSHCLCPAFVSAPTPHSLNSFAEEGVPVTRVRLRLAL
jgi:hypothetical protein